MSYARLSNEDCVVFDLTTLLMAAVAVVGLIAVDSGLHSNVLYLSINVPPKMADQGFTQPVAELEFLTESAATEEVGDMVRPPAIRVASNKTISSALAEPLRLVDLTRAIQDYVGGRLTINGTVIPDGKALKLAMVLSLPDGRLRTLEVVEEDGDPFKLMRIGANAALAYVSPTRAVVMNFRRSVATGSPTMAEVRAQLDRELAKTGVEAKYQNRSLLWTLRGAVAFHEGDLALSRRALDWALQSPDLIPLAQSVAYLDRAFLEITERNSAQALADAEASQAVVAAVPLPGYSSMVAVTRALAQWAGGEPIEAERTLRGILQVEPHQLLALHYLNLITKTNDGTAIVHGSHPSEAAPTPIYPSVLPSVFLVDPTNWTATRRPT
jgi:hypothetical protein